MKEPRIFPRERPTPWTRAPLPPRGRLDGSLGPQGGPVLNTGHPLGVNSDPFLMAAGSLGGNLTPFPRNPSPFPASSGSLASNPAPFPAGARDPSMASFPRGMNPTGTGIHWPAGPSSHVVPCSPLENQLTAL
ncbi:decreased expression in renal and prostate cancer protein isoform X2 [Nomascus leucogenys]|uniref:decreased expression in renal and prostate cancer protein isoform 2 n=1 Tax=Homo sapiens TaxID=9606 RepID=UPI0000EE59C2|nr:decreased expression in renal and prostate cancer protein isoform 2 [Homo sapiens]NP_001353534.1 decreased expression in renal and prostate cancer protein isoform 2 [Homo sapiens]NP_001353535.1 decreased expression in renal and prostate cancer protein isoform 2 [Homo sapiens]XP_030650684.1 decreased expression in renal and prostate cancer protein isoform X2 [Nomascus leucogenys]XP_030650688.1 decreased expression in renal and prostate cancer protein isoform X2 [Nomascus leucogenys]XP_030650